MKKIICIFLSVIMIFLFTACSDKPISLGGESEENEDPITNNSSNKNNSSSNNSTNNGDDSTVQNNKYANIQKIVAAYDDIYIFQNYNGTYGLLSTDGNIIYDGFYLYQPFSESSNYLSCHDGKSALTINWKVSSIIDKKGNTVLAIGKNNIEYISDITQGRILAYQMTDERPSGKIYDLICYSAKDMSEIFRLSDQYQIGYYLQFDTTGYESTPGGDIYFDINGNIYRKSNYRYYDAGGKEYTENQLPQVYGLEPVIDYSAWLKLAEAYSEYKNSPYNTREYEVGTTKNTLGQIATLYMKNTSEWCATMDMNGNILMPPTKDVIFKYRSNPTELYVFSNDLCGAYQPSSGLWGYVDPYGNWKIAPKYNSVTTFSYAGYAVVDDLFVIDTTGKIVLDISDKGDIHPLEGKYKLSGASLYLTFSKDGTIVVRNDWVTVTGTYEIHGNSLVVNELGINTIFNDGTRSFEQSGDTLIIDGNRWILQEDQ